MENENGPSSIGHLPDRKWEFDDQVTAVFDDMLHRSIPQYDVMRQSVFELARKFVSKNSIVLDLGCSRGEALAPFVTNFARVGMNVRFVGLEISSPMVQAATKFYDGSLDVVQIMQHDLRSGLPTSLDEEYASVILSVLTLQFTPIEYRLEILSQIRKCLRPDGAFIFVEKVLGGSADLDRAFVDRYLSMKQRNGYSDEEIQRKRLALEGVLVPVTAKWNEELLRMSGFAQVDCFWRWMNFAGWIALPS